MFFYRDAALRTALREVEGGLMAGVVLRREALRREWETLAADPSADGEDRRLIVRAELVDLEGQARELRRIFGGTPRRRDEAGEWKDAPLLLRAYAVLLWLLVAWGLGQTLRGIFAPPPL